MPLPDLQLLGNRSCLVRAELELTPPALRFFQRVAVNLKTQYLADTEFRYQLYESVLGAAHESGGAYDVHSSLGYDRLSVRTIVAPSFRENFSSNTREAVEIVLDILLAIGNEPIKETDKLVLVGGLFATREILYHMVPVIVRLWQKQQISPCTIEDFEALDYDLLSFINTELSFPQELSSPC